MSRWFRMYDELLDDPKVQRLASEDFRAWVNLLCLASRCGGKIPTVSETAFALRTDDSGALAVLERLSSAGLIDRVAGGGDGWHYAPHGWAKRQFKSDTSTSRVKRFRQRSETATVTAPETDTETEVLLSKDNSDPEKIFWDSAKAFLGKNRGSLIAKWLRDRGKEMTRAAIAAAQLEKAVDPIAYIEGYFRRHSANGHRDGYPPGHSGVPL